MSGELPADHAEALGIEPARLRRVADTASMWAGMLRAELDDGAPHLDPDDVSARQRAAERGEVQRRQVAALLTWAGSARLVLGDPGSEDLLTAARHLAVVGSADAHTLFVCAGVTEPYDLSGLDVGPQDLVPLLVRLTWLRHAGRDDDPALLETLGGAHRRAADAGTAHVGRARIPVRLTLRVLESLDLIEDPGPDGRAVAVQTVIDTLRDWLARAGEATAEARRDRFHWQRMLGSTLPVEPEQVALIAAVMAAAQRHGLERQVLEALPREPVQRVPMLVGAEIARRGGRDAG